MAKKRRRSNGEGTIYQVDGKWIAQISYYKDGKLKRPKRTCTKHADAVAKLEELRREAQQLDMDEQHHTVETYLTEWLDEVKNSSRTFSTYKSYRGIVKNHVIPHIGRVKLKELKPSKIKAMIKTLQQTEAGSRQVELAYFCLNHALNQAYKSDIILKNPCISVNRPVHKSKAAVPFTKEERKLIFSEAEGTQYEYLYRFLLSTGLRFSEACGLHWSDIDYHSKTIHIQRQFIFGGYEPLKSKYSDRYIDLTPGLESVLEKHKSLMESKKFHGKEHVFCAHRGGHINSSTFSQRVWNPLLEDAGVPVRGLHHLRHTFASELLAAGADLLVVSKLLGHSSPVITLQVYAHALPPKRSQVADKIQDLFG